MNSITWFALVLVVIAIIGLVSLLNPSIAVYVIGIYALGWAFASVPVLILAVIGLGVAGALK